MTNFKRVALVAGVLAVLGCSDVSEYDPNAGSDPGTGDPNDPNDPAASEACSKMDLVFVIDNSGSMAEEQANLTANFGPFAELIDSYLTSDGNQLDYRIAVTTAGRDVSYKLTAFDMEFPFTEPGDNGNFVNRSECGMSRPWIERGDSDVVGTFECAANVGTYGPGAEMPLLGLEWALNRRVQDGTNAGFLRDDALLAVVMVSDQDDCSREDDGFTIDGTQPTCFDPNDSNIISLDTYLGFLDGLKGGRGRWATAVMAGPGPGSCESSFGTAAEAVRLGDFVDQTGQNGRFSSICDGDLTTALEDALDTFAAACEAFPPVQ
ncbi:MAG: hypothetical protein KJO07_21910 [Deltaproteobacteria bacterium]|nr:hypothetical protein [Deltaproteobacteria bacterium]